MDSLVKYRRSIAQTIRALRQGRRWTQAELAKRLGLSQSRLSEIERGAGSFTAEQLLLILRLFNVGIDAFDATPAAASVELQNALARHGATHLRESAEVLPKEGSRDVANVIRSTLTEAESSRLITALAPVIVQNIDAIRLAPISARLAEVGLEHRWGWLVENTLEAVRRERTPALPRSWDRRYRRAETVLDLFLESPIAQPRSPSTDLLDPTIRSRRTADELAESSSPISKRWGIVTNLDPDDFAAALRGARAGD